LAALCAAALIGSAAPAHALRVATWNLMRFQSNNVVSPIATRTPAIRTVLAAMQPDIVLVEEVNDSGARDSLLNNVFNVLEPGQWAVQWTSLATSGEGGGIFYKPAKVTISNFGTIVTGGPRPIIQALCKPVGYNNKAGWFRIYTMHLKAGNPTFTPADSATRRLECSSIRTTLNNVITTNVGTNFILGGDTNFYGDWEGGYQRLTESQANNNGRCADLLVMPGTWNSNSAYAFYDTQCPQLSPSTSDFSGGGMDDRFDMILSSASMQDGNGLDMRTGSLPGGYGAFGNDGQHFNTDINGGGFNAMVGITVATALHDAADHIPVVSNLQLPAKVAAASQIDFGRMIVGATVTSPLNVNNSAAAPADLLRYTLAAPAGFTAPAGSFSTPTGGGGNTHDIGVVTSAAGNLSGTLNVATNDVDSTLKTVKLAAVVLDHAVASLDSVSKVTTGSLDFGVHPAGGFTDLSVRVHDKGYNALRSKLQLNTAWLLGGDGHFKFRSAFTPVQLAGTGLTLNAYFDPAYATLDSTYTGTLQITGTDESLPGGAAADTILVQLQARVTSASTGVGAGSAALRFLPPRPNPFTRSTELAFDLATEAPVSLAIYDLSGRRVALLADSRLGEGHHSLRWNTQDESGRTVPAGLYFVRFQTPGLTRVARLALLP
jgi:hypothetical protein